MTTDTTSTTDVSKEEDVIYEQVRNPSTLELMIDPSTGKPRTRRVSSVDNPEEYQRIMSQLQEADKRRQEQRLREEQELNTPPTIMRRLMPHPKTGEVNYWAFIVEKSTGREILLENRELALPPEELRKRFSGKFHCSYCNTNWFTEQERSLHMNSHYARPRS